MNSPSNKWMRVVVGLSILLLTLGDGCFDDDPTAGDTDPKKGTYRVTVTYQSGDPHNHTEIEFEIIPGVATYSAGLDITASCEGQNLPPNCESNPDWHVLKAPGTDFLTVQVTDPAQTSTHVTVTLKTSAYYDEYGDTPAPLGGARTFTIGFVPGTLPP